METYQERIEKKYKKVATIPEGLLRFTTPTRRKAISLLNLKNGSTVLDVGCGTGASFPYLEELIGEDGKIVGIEPSRSMINGARERINKEGWNNVILHESMIEDFQTGEKFDGALLFAMQDVFNSIEGIKKIHSLLHEGAHIVCVGPKIQVKGVLTLANPMLHLLFKRMAISQENKDKPWRLVGEVFHTENIIEEKHGLIFIYIGRK